MKNEYDFSKGSRGAVIPLPPGKTRVTIPLDDRVLEYFECLVDRAGGGDYGALMNQVLRDYIAGQQENLEETFRRVLREELAEYRP